MLSDGLPEREPPPGHGEHGVGARPGDYCPVDGGLIDETCEHCGLTREELDVALRSGSRYAIELVYLDGNPFYHARVGTLAAALRLEAGLRKKHGSRLTPHVFVTDTNDEERGALSDIDYREGLDDGPDPIP